MRLSVSKDFFLQFASKTWISPFSIIRELVEDSYDEDATRVIITIGDGYAVVEDDVGMDSEALSKFLVVGSTHKQLAPTSPKFGRARTGRYGTGRLSFLAFFKSMKVRTRRGGFSASIVLSEECVAGLADGKAEVKVLDDPPLERDGSEIWLLDAASKLDARRIVKELRELPILHEPMFEVWLRVGEFKPWSLEGAFRIEPPEVAGEKIDLSLDGISGRITVAARPLSDEERGIAVLHGGHMVMKSLFGFPPSQMSRVAGWVKCDWLNVRFADKSAVIEDEAYERFKTAVRRFIMSEVLPRTAEVQEWLTYGEVNAFKTIDKLLSKVMAAEREAEGEKHEASLPEPASQAPEAPAAPSIHEPQFQESPHAKPQQPTQPMQPVQPVQTPQPVAPQAPNTAFSHVSYPRLKKPVPKRARLPGVGYDILPYADESDDREFFTEGRVLFINRKHPAYMKELARGRDFLVRHILRVVASALALAEFPDRAEALERANRLIAEVLRLI